MHKHIARLRGGGCCASVQQERVKEVSFPAASKGYDDAASIWEAMRAGEAILVRASWLLKRAGYEEGEVEVEVGGTSVYDHARAGPKMIDTKKVMKPGWVQRREAAPLPHRSQIEKDHPEAIMPVEECEAGHNKMRAVLAGKDTWGRHMASEAQRAALDAVPVLVASHCWETPDHPDPEARTLRALAKELAGTWGDDDGGFRVRPESGLPLYRAWGLSDVGVFVDWASLYQKPRSDAQAACFGRALANMSLWYAHRLTTVLLARGQDARLFEYEKDASGALRRTERPNARDGRGWPYYEQARRAPAPSPPLPS